MPIMLSRLRDAVAWVLRLVAAAFWGYALYAAWVGRVRVATRSIDIVIEYASSPLPFIAAVSLFVAGGALFVWMAGPITNRE